MYIKIAWKFHWKLHWEICWCVKIDFIRSQFVHSTRNDTGITLFTFLYLLLEKNLKGSEINGIYQIIILKQCVVLIWVEIE